MFGFVVLLPGCIFETWGMKLGRDKEVGSIWEELGMEKNMIEIYRMKKVCFVLKKIHDYNPNK